MARANDDLVRLAALTDQERRVAVAVGSGASNKAAARELTVSVKTVEFHLRNIFRKLDLDSRSALAHLVGRATSGGSTLDAATGNLPHRSASFIDREDDVATIVGLVGATRLVTLTGTGGVGKTSLAIVSAHAAALDFADGAWLVELGSLSAGADVCSLARSALRLHERTQNPSPADVAAALGLQHRLIVLDNCEHVVESAAALASAIMRLAPCTAVLATSRERLDVDGEQVFVVAPMGLEPDHGRSAAVRLFVERAVAIVGSFEPDVHDELVIDEICRRLDGLPLAIELAAARTVGLTVSEICDRLGDRFRLLSRSRAPEHRHRSLLATIEWSYELLGARERATFESLAVFSGDFDLISAIAVCDPGLQAADIEDGITALVERSLLVAKRASPSRRFQFLETVREFAGLRLDERGDRQIVERRHMARFMEFAHDAKLALRTRDELSAHTAIVGDWHNIRTAVRIACDADQGAAACTIINDILFWSVTRLRAEPGEWCHRARSLPSTAALTARVAMTAGAAYYTYMAGDLVSARVLLATAREEEARLGPMYEPIVPEVESFLVTDGATAVQVCNELQARAQHIGVRFFQVLGLLHESIARALFFVTPGQLDAVRRDDEIRIIRHAYQQALEFGNPNLIGAGAMALGNALSTIDLDAARPFLEQARAITAPLGLSLLSGQCSRALADLHTLAGRPTEALEVLSDALRMHVTAGAIADVVHDLVSCIEPLHKVGESALATAVAAVIGSTDHQPAPSGLRIAEITATVLARIEPIPHVDPIAIPPHQAVRPSSALTPSIKVVRTVTRALDADNQT